MEREMNSLSDNFLWGAASAASQYEGGYLEGGRGLSTSDILPLSPVRMKICRGEYDYTTLSENEIYPSRVATDFYHHWREDIKLMGEMGLKSYRFSVSWTRIFPTGEEETPNEDGLLFYEQVVDELRKYHIEPVITLCHFDLPLSLQRRYGGWSNRKLIELFERYCETVLLRLKGKVKYYITFNEINMILHMPFIGAGISFTSEDSRETVLYQAAHHQLVASAMVTKFAHELDPEIQIGCMFAAGKIYPRTCAPEDVWMGYTRERENLMFTDVQVRGYYPAYVRKMFGSKKIHLEMESTDEDLLRNNTVDYISISYYSTRCVSSDANIEYTASNAFDSVKNPYLKASDWGWEIDPLGFRTTLNDLYDRYQKPIFVVENGIGAVDEVSSDGKIHDHYRIDYLEKHIRAMEDAVLLDGVDVIGYTAWSFTDITAASTGQMKKRYGFVYVDQDDQQKGTQKRICKDSYHWYRQLIAENGRMES